MLGATVRASEQGIFPVQRDRADGTLDCVVVELDAAIVEEAGEALPARQCVVDRLGEFALLADQTKFCAQPRLQCVDQRPAFLLPGQATLLGAAATDVLLNRIYPFDCDGYQHSNGKTKWRKLNRRSWKHIEMR